MRDYLLAGVIGLSYLLNLPLHAANEMKPPNIWLILTDELRSPLPLELEDPALQKFAHEELLARRQLTESGVSFMNHHTGASACSPSRATLLTGHYPQVHGLQHTFALGKEPEDQAIEWLQPKTLPTMGDIFRAAGYETAWHGKWHISYENIYDTSGQLLHCLSPKGDLLQDNIQTYLDANKLDKFGWGGWIGPEPHGQDDRFLGETVDQIYSDQSIAWLQEREQKNTQEPFFLVTSLVNPHDVAYFLESLFTLQQLTDPTVPPIPLPLSYNEDLSGKPEIQQLYVDHFKQIMLPDFLIPIYDFFYFSNPDLLLRHYYSLQKKVDKEIQHMLEALAKSRFHDNTIVVFTSDHGDMLSSHGGMQHKWHSAYQEILHIPLIISGPPLGDHNRGRRIEQLSSHIDLIPTLTGLVGADLDELLKKLTTSHSRVLPLPGQDLSRAITDPSTGEGSNEQTIYYMTGDEISAGDNRVRMFFRYHLPTWSHEWFAPYQEIEGVASHVEAIITRREGQTHKFVRYYDPQDRYPEEFEYYHLDTDPYELNNLPLTPSRLAELQRWLAEEKQRKVEPFVTTTISNCS